MKSVISSTALCAALLAQSSMGSRLRHEHLHARQAAAKVAAPKEKRTTTSEFISTADVAILDAAGVLVGENIASSVGGAVTIGDNGGTFVVQYNNLSPKDIIVVVWGAYGETGAADASFVTAYQAAVTTSLASNSTAYVSFDTTASTVTDNAISGAWAAIYPDTTVLTEYGQLDQTIGEYTFTSADDFSTTDVSRLINMDGAEISISNYASLADYQGGDAAACYANNTEKAFVCASGETTCDSGTIIGCTAGAANTTCDADGVDGGCSGLLATGGYIIANFY